ncbi:MAG: hypothetical protein SO072_13605 [Dysosmobacter sp.]|nr:hypothetical protein [Dysosmobacter sp.]
MTKNQTEDRLSEHIRQLEAENNQLTGKLKAANLEIQRMHQQVLLAKAAAKEATSEVSSTCHAVYIGAALRLGTSVSPTAREVVLPYIEQSLAEKYTLSIRRNDKTRTMVVRVEEKGGA